KGEGDQDDQGRIHSFISLYQQWRDIRSFTSIQKSLFSKLEFKACSLTSSSQLAKKASVRATVKLSLSDLWSLVQVMGSTIYSCVKVGCLHPANIIFHRACVHLPNYHAPPSTTISTHT
ncbi:hypothetical protein H5410_064166, partial [Solanum commersonii]